MKKLGWIILLVFVCFPLTGWDLGILQFPLMIPFGGYTSEAGFPVAVRNLDFPFFQYFGISTSLLLHNIPGLPISQLPFTVDEPAFGPTYTLIGQLALKVMIPVGSFFITAKGGGFAFLNLAPRLLRGALDRAIASANGWDAATSNLTFPNKIGYGWLAGGSLTYFLWPNLAAVFFEVLYYDGQAPLELTGNVIGAKKPNIIVEQAVAYAGAVDLTALEFTLGLLLRL
jgi:hypothetical protein